MAPGLLKRWWLRVQARRRGKPLVAWRLSAAESGLTAEWARADLADRGTTVIAWGDVVQVAAFKRDLYTVDEICLLLTTSSGTVVELDEGMGGFQELTFAFADHLPGCLPFEDWWPRVAFPAFEKNWTVLWERDAGTR